MKANTDLMDLTGISFERNNREKRHKVPIYVPNIRHTLEESKSTAGKEVVRADKADDKTVTIANNRASATI